jgi:hypothetical protein
MDNKDELYVALNQWYVIDGKKMKIMSYVSSGDSIVMQDGEGNTHIVELAKQGSGNEVEDGCKVCTAPDNADYSTTSMNFLNDIASRAKDIYGLSAVQPTSHLPQTTDVLPMRGGSEAINTLRGGSEAINTLRGGTMADANLYDATHGNDDTDTFFRNNMDLLNTRGRGYFSGGSKAINTFSGGRSGKTHEVPIYNENVFYVGGGNANIDNIKRNYADEIFRSDSTSEMCGV